VSDQPEREPDLEAMYRHGGPADDVAPDGAQLAMIEGLTGLHWAWYTAWMARGFTPEQAFRLVRDMIFNSQK
jgi:hypothetical protein